MTGRFITLEGGEGAGKSTQCARLVQHRESTGIAAEKTREPGGSPGAEDVRALIVEGDPDRWDATTEALLIYAARRDHLRRRIEPALASGRWVVCDRFSDSTMAYQGIAGGLGRDWIARLDALAIDGRKPELTLVLDLPAADGLARAARRGGADRFERHGTAFHERLRTAFLEIAAAAPERCRIIDAGRDPDAVAADIWETVQMFFGIAGG